MSRPERRAVLLLLCLAVAGQALRQWITRPGDAPGDVQLLTPSLTGSPQAHRDSALRQDRPLRPGERIDLDRAPVHELTRLPHIGPALARAIVADREARGPFGSLDGLDRVPGVGQGLLKSIGEHVTFSGIAAAARGGGTSAPGDSQPPHRRARPRSREPVIPAGQLDLNSADSSALEQLPGIGPYMAGRIIAYRMRHGSFGSVDELVKVGGVGPATLAKIRDRLRVE